MTDTSTPRRGNPAGIASLAVAILLLLASIAAHALAPALPLLLDQAGMSYRVVPLLITGPQVLLAIIAAVLGIIGLLLRDRPRVLALIGTTLGVSHLVVAVVGALASGVVAALLAAA
ncbi:hypothetical protein [Brachybacterium sp. YJGR34]|uniref:hypothetical protein n=1 Tax=Brachybacterium sp. YJGR34 TaxID=2059911 RepID=UPI000E0C3B66|nr:hypothetical protein [Brachybacterium sp. YJGR34]